MYEEAVSSDKVLYGRHGMADQARNHRESGYHSLVALVLAMQADAFVITSGSNWSRLMEVPRARPGAACAMVDVTRGGRHHRRPAWRGVEGANSLRAGAGRAAVTQGGVGRGG